MSPEKPVQLGAEGSESPAASDPSGSPSLKEGQGVGSDLARVRLARRSRLHTDRITGKPVLLFPEGVLMLNRTGVAIAALCDGTRTIGEIIETLDQRYGGADVRPDVIRFLTRLLDRGLLQIATEAP
ncbi:MAG: pyrroloquinoline quinone biosynthesis peptide chaperone PqqD [Capsulimonadaceae bacterium]